MTSPLLRPDRTPLYSGKHHAFEIIAPNMGTLVAKVIGLGLMVASAIAFAPILIAQRSYVFLAVWLVVVVATVGIYITGRMIPVKYLFPGSIMLVLFLIYPMIMTFEMSFTNFGGGTRTNKAEAVESILSDSAVQVSGTPFYGAVVGTKASATKGPFDLLLVDPDTNKTYVVTRDGGKQELPGATVKDGQVTAAPGYTVLTRAEQNALSGSGDILDQFSLPIGERTEIRVEGFSAVELQTPLVWDAKADTITNVETHTVYSPERVKGGNRSLFTDHEGDVLSQQSWKEGIGWFNYAKIFTDREVVGPFLGIFVWTVIFAVLSVVSTFFLGLLLAMLFNEPRMELQKVYRAILIFPYAIPGFISLLLWSSFWNQDYGLINQILGGVSINWLGDATLAKIAVLMTNLWLGFPYMFLISTGALQSIPQDLTEAAELDGARGPTRFMRLTLPLVLVSTAPLLVQSFAFNFNNFNAIQLLTQGGPFSPTNPSAGGTDILISYTYRLAFGTGQQEIGFAAAVSVILFILTAVLAGIQFRGTRYFEGIMS